MTCYLFKNFTNAPAFLLISTSCLSCGEICVEKFILNCGEQQFCDTCSETIVAGENPKCPRYTGLTKM